MNNEMKIFENKEFGKVRTVLKDGESWFVGKDVCECLSIGNSREALSRLDDDEKGVILTDTLGGKQEIVYINESGLYSLILSSRKPEAKKFKKWVTSEVLPSIRKNGGYIVEKENDTPEEIMARALVVAQDTLKRREERIKSLELKAEQDRPLVEFADTVIKSKDNITINEMAKIINDENINIGRNKLFGFLRSKNVLMKNNTPYQKYISNDWFTTTEVTKDTPYGVKLFVVTLVKPKGQIGIVDMVRREYKAGVKWI